LQISIFKYQEVTKTFNGIIWFFFDVADEFHRSVCDEKKQQYRDTRINALYICIHYILFYVENNVCVCITKRRGKSRWNLAFSAYTYVCDNSYTVLIYFYLSSSV